MAKTTKYTAEVSEGRDELLDGKTIARLRTIAVKNQRGETVRELKAADNDEDVRAKLRARFGRRLVAMVSGGARLDPELSGFFLALGVTVLQGYGQTEAGPVISCNRPRAGVRMETVGPPLMNSEVRIADDGEIMVRGEQVMHGYWRNEAETARVLQESGDGKGPWLATGDVGHLDEAGRKALAAAALDPAPHADDLPGSLRQPQPALEGARHRRRAVAGARPSGRDCGRTRGSDPHRRACR